MATSDSPVLPESRTEKLDRQRRHRTSKTELPQESTAKYCVKRRSGGRFGSLKPVFSKDEKHLFLCTKLQARVYSASTGELIRSLVPKTPQRSALVSIFLHPKNDYRLITVSRNGKLFVWDWTDGSLINELAIEPATEIAASLLIGNTFIWTDGKHISAAREFPAVHNVHPISRLAVCYGLSTNGEHVFAHGDRSVMIFKLKPGGSTLEHEYLTLPTPYTSFAVSEKAYAYADSSGAIYLYELNAFEKNKESVPRKLHWHSAQVPTLEFALSGQYLLSGGHEGVLVLWQLTTSNKQYLPRISHTIESIATSTMSKYYALKLADNTIKIINATDLTLRAEISGPRYVSEPISSTAHKDNLLISNGPEVQVWNLPTGRTALRVPITPQTFAGQVRDQYRAVEATVDKCATNGLWMATLDSWSTPREEAADYGYSQVRDETHLKFWKWQDNQYKLTTRIDDPHGLSRTRELLATSSGKFFTVGDDASIKLWREKPVKKDLIGGGTQVIGSTWSCHRAIRLTKASQGCKLAVSSDESVLALYAQNQLFLIDPSTGDLRKTITGLSAGQVVEIGFVRHFLVILGYKRLVVWNMLKSNVGYALRIPEPTTDLHLSCGERTFVLSTNEHTKQTKANAKIFVFDPESPKPVFREKCSKTLTLSWSCDIGFLQVTDDLEVVIIAPDVEEARSSESAEASQAAPTQLGISSMYRPIKRDADVDMEDADMQNMVLNTQKVSTIFDDPIKSLEDRFEALASLVLGAPKEAFE